MLLRWIKSAVKGLGKIHLAGGFLMPSRRNLLFT